MDDFYNLRININNAQASLHHTKKPPGVMSEALNNIDCK